MPLSFYAKDEEFGGASGQNVNSAGTSSRFDGAHAGFTDLVVTANSDDEDPRRFEVGDRYDLDWETADGANGIQDAVVVRSDAAPGQGGVIVFEGVDAQGQLTQIIWTPDFDLQGWCATAIASGQQPHFYTNDQQADYDHQFVCFAAETAISGSDGPIPAGAVRAGDLVRTLDHGLQPVRWVGQCAQPGYGRAAPVLFEPGSMGNDAPLRLSQQHRVMLQSPVAELYFGANEVLVPAKAMIDGAAVRLAPCPDIVYVHILLASHDILLAEGVPCESLLLGDRAMRLLDAAGHDDPAELGAQARSQTAHRHIRPARPILSMTEARTLLRHVPQPDARALANTAIF